MPVNATVRPSRESANDSPGFARRSTPPRRATFPEVRSTLRRSAVRDDVVDQPPRRRPAHLVEPRAAHGQDRPLARAVGGPHDHQLVGRGAGRALRGGDVGDLRPVRRPGRVHAGGVSSAGDVRGAALTLAPRPATATTSAAEATKMRPRPTPPSVCAGDPRAAARLESTAEARRPAIRPVTSARPPERRVVAQRPVRGRQHGVLQVAHRLRRAGARAARERVADAVQAEQRAVVATALGQAVRVHHQLRAG